MFISVCLNKSSGSKMFSKGSNRTIIGGSSFLPMRAPVRVQGVMRVAFEGWLDVGTLGSELRISMLKPWVRKPQNSMLEPWVRELRNPCSNLGFGNSRTRCSISGFENSGISCSNPGFGAPNSMFEPGSGTPELDVRTLGSGTPKLDVCSLGFGYYVLRPSHPPRCSNLEFGNTANTYAKQDLCSF